MQKASQTQQSHQLAIKPQLQDAAQGPIHDSTRTMVSESIKVERVRRSPKWGATGPRTEAGKQRASRNAIKHAIFSEVTVLPGESAEKYGSLLEELRDTLQPEGGLEELLVEKLASVAWRHRRLLLAEGAEIRRGQKFLESDREFQQRKEAEAIGTLTVFEQLGEDAGPGLIWEIQNPAVLERCLELLLELRRQIKERGLDSSEDTSILNRIYGSNKHLRETLRESYDMWSETAQASDEERQTHNYATPEQCTRNILSEIQTEICRLRAYQKKSASIESERMKLEILRCNIPEPERLDRLLRYEASLERAFDRTLNQLERMQRLRRGQAVAPRIDVNVSTGA